MEFHENKAKTPFIRLVQLASSRFVNDNGNVWMVLQDTCW